MYMTFGSIPSSRKKKKKVEKEEREREKEEKRRAPFWEKRKSLEKLVLGN
jgi:hypothetical protein